MREKISYWPRNSEIYKPITEGIESQKEELSRQLKTLPEIEKQLTLIQKSISEDLVQGITELTKECRK